MATSSLRHQLRKHYLLVNNSISHSCFPHDSFMVIIFCRCFVSSLSLLRAFESRTLRCCGTLNTVEPLLTVTVARSCVVSPSAAIFSSLIDGCLKYKSKEKSKTGGRPGPRLNYDVKIGPKPGPRCKKFRVKCRALDQTKS